MRRVPDTPVAGMVLMTVAMAMVPGLDVIAKLLMETLSPLETAVGRFVAQTAVLLPIVLWAGRMERPRRLHAVAGAFLGAALLCINMALREMPVANAIAIFFVEPLVLTLMAAAVLGERIGARRLAAIGVGLVGVLIVLRPNLAAYGPAAAWPLATAVLFSAYMLATRVMTRTGSRLALQFWTGVFAALTLSAGLAVERAAGGVAGHLGARELGLLLMLGCLAALAHQIIVHAIARAEAGQLAPFQYLEIVSATLLGFLVFGDFPDALTWAGTALIVAAGLYVFHRERRLSRSAGGPAERPPGPLPG